MSKIIELKEIFLQAGDESDATKFPGVGFYYATNQSAFIMVYPINGINYTFTVYGNDAINLVSNFKDNTAELTSTMEWVKTPGTISEEFTLRMLSIALNNDSYLSTINPKETLI